MTTASHSSSDRLSAVLTVDQHRRFVGRRVHLLGIGGAGVSALVPLLQARGAKVSGCDSRAGEMTRRVAALDVPVSIGHDPEHTHGCDLVVHSAAVPLDHPELAAARAAGIEVIDRGTCLQQLMADQPVIAIAGSHGKTSTTWMCGHLLTEAGADPTVMVGGAVGALGGGGARAGASGLFVAEVDESDGSFAQVQPRIAVVTNLDREHLRHYGSLTALEDAFHAWLRQMPASSTIIIPATGWPERLRVGVVARLLTVGLDRGDCQVRDLELGADGSQCMVMLHGRSLGRMSVPIPGVHMVLNALMALLAARAACPGVDPAVLGRCERVGRRFTVHGVAHGMRVVEDYGHHPAEIRATIAAARLGGGRVQVLFQPHRFSRTADCFDEFCASFDQADRVALLPIYAASEAPIAGISSACLAEAITQRRGESVTVRALSDADEASRFLIEGCAPGDTVLVLGAGDVGGEAPRMLGIITDFFVAGRREPAKRMRLSDSFPVLSPGQDHLHALETAHA